jgi:hypothetical protein
VGQSAHDGTHGKTSMGLRDLEFLCSMGFLLFAFVLISLWPILWSSIIGASRSPYKFYQHELRNEWSDMPSHS